MDTNVTNDTPPKQGVPVYAFTRKRRDPGLTKA